MGQFHFLSWLTVAALLVLPAQQGSAQIAQAASDAENRSADEVEGRARFEAGRAAFARGRFEDALDDFQRAYRLTARPLLLFNIGNAADRLRRDDLALEAFEAYLVQVPEAPNREEARSAGTGAARGGCDCAQCQPRRPARRASGRGGHAHERRAASRVRSCGVGFSPLQEGALALGSDGSGRCGDRVGRLAGDLAALLGDGGLGGAGAGAATTGP